MFINLFAILLAANIQKTYSLLQDWNNVPYNPDEDLDVPQIIARHGYPSETHTIVTDDGYILSLHRIPGSKNGTKGNQPVFLQHGLLGSSADWLINGNISLGFLLANKGYDVWLGNSRGNTYSKGHISLPLDQAQYWDFSWHEMGVQDLPKAISYVSNFTQKSGEIIYIGHSMGTTQFFVFSSLVPEIARELKVAIALAPVGYMTHVKSPIRYLAPFSYDIEWIAKYLGVNSFLPNNKLLKFLAYDCELLNIEKDICDNVLFILAGFDQQELNKAILPVLFRKDPAGTSTKTLIHYAQEIKSSGKFQRYDYGPDENIKKYNSIVPPRYNLNTIKQPVYLMYGKNDWLAGYIDVEKLSQELPNLVDIYGIPMEYFNHVDFLFGKDADVLVYLPILNLLQNYTMTKQIIN